MHKRDRIRRQRALAKAGMLGTLGVVVWTGYQRGRRFIPWHTAAGVAMIGFTLWHMGLYCNNGNNSKSRQEVKRRAPA